MKKTLLFVATMLVACNLFAQEIERRNGYIGICAGPAFPVGDIDNSQISGGAQLNLVNFGYLFSDHVGIAATWFGTSFVAKYDSDYSIGTGGMLAGPLFSTATKDYKGEFDFKPMIGFARGNERYMNETYTTSAAFACALSGTARWNCGRKISVSAGLDYYFVKPDGLNMSSFAIMFGINYRLK